jgi:hypothetical protein
MAFPRNGSVRHHAGRAWRFYHSAGLHEAVVVVTAFLVYFLIRGAVVDRVDEAILRAERLIEFEQRLGFYWELQMQSWILDSQAAIKVVNWIYFWGHMPVVAVFAVWLYLRRRSTYFLVRNAFLASGAIGVVIYWLFPVAPPRLVPDAGFVDTMAIFSRTSYQAQEMSWFVNQYAAVPSLHFGWALLLGGVVAWVGRPRVFFITAGSAWPVAMFFSIVLTGNHFIIDAVIGGAVAFAGLGIAFALHRVRPAAVARLRERVADRGGRLPQAEPPA